MFGKPAPLPEPEPETDIMPTLLALAVCWLLPLVLYYASNASAKKAADAILAKCSNSTYVVIGASSGIGLELTKQLAARGSKVFATVRKPNAELSAIKGDVTVVTGIDVASNDVGAAIAKSKLKGITIDALVHNAGSYDGGVGNYGKSIPELFGSQKLDAVTMESMKACFDVNALGPLRVAKALHAQIADGGKLAIVSTQLGSIDDNTSGGSYAYRSSKTAVNMIGKSLSCDLRAKNVSVQLLAPGFVATEFGPGSEAMKKMGAKDVTPSVVGVIQALDAMTMDNSGTFVHTNYGLGLKKSLW